MIPLCGFYGRRVVTLTVVGVFIHVITRDFHPYELFVIDTRMTAAAALSIASVDCATPNLPFINSMHVVSATILPQLLVYSPYRYHMSWIVVERGEE
jgi:hypothetical protein